MKPNFMIIGAARSGTTSLHKYLEAHPDIFMSDIKEINFFSSNEIYKKGVKWYLRHFRGATERLVGEASTSYTLAPSRDDVPARIHELLGPIKLIYILRDPIDRLLSHYFHYVQRGQMRQSLDDLFTTKTHSIFKQGCYAYQLSRYLAVFPRENIHILTVNQLKNEPEQTVSDLYQFLGVSNDVSNINVRKSHNANVAVTDKSSFGKKVLAFYHRQVEPRSFPYPVKKLFLKFAELGSTEAVVPELSHKQLDELLEYYGSDVKTLRDRFGVDVTEWRKYD